MALSQKHGLYYVGIGNTTLGGIIRQNLAIANDIKGDANSGEVYKRWQALYGQRIAPGFATVSLAVALGQCGAAGASIAAMTGGLCLYAQKHLDGGTRAGANLHRKFSMAKGILFPTRLTAGHQGDATLEYQAVVTYDGTNDPVVITDSVSLPAAVADDGRWTLGKTTIGGITLNGKTQVTVNFGISVASEGTDSDIWDRWSSIQTIDPSITIEGKDVTWFAASGVPLAGLTCTNANTAIYLRKRALCAQFVADGTASHIKMTATGYAYVTKGMDADVSKPADIELTLPLYYDGTNLPLIITTGSAIT